MRKVLLILGLGILGIVIIVTTWGVILISGYLGKINYDTGTLPDKQSPASSPVYNVLLVGVDAWGASEPGNTGAMLLVSIDRRSSRIIETSLLGDIYVNIPGQMHGNCLNTSYNLGGPALLLETIRDNFKIQVDKYVAVNYASFTKIIDQLGGISLYISGEELEEANNHIKEINQLEGLPSDDGMLTTPGMRQFTGRQALGFVRICNGGKNDFSRTDRLRMVVNLAFDKVKTLNFKQLDCFLNVFLPELKTNLERREIMSLMLAVPKLAGYRVESWTLPVDGTYALLIVRGINVLGIDFDQNDSALQKRLYG